MAVKITIIGMDALGQSLSLALKNSQRGSASVVIHDRDRTRFDEASQAGVAHHAEWNFLRAVEGASLIVINEPLHELRETLELLATELKGEVVITDTGSHKAAIMEWAALLPDHLHYVGGTPLVTAREPSATLFQDRRYAIIPAPRASEDAVRLLSDAVGMLGAEPLYMEVAEHDVLMAAMVQIPALMGAALTSMTARSGAWRDMALLVDVPYESATTLPYDDAAALVGLFRHSREPLLRWLETLQEELDDVRMLLTKEDEGEALAAYLKSVLAAQRRWHRQLVSSPEEEERAKVMDEVGEVTGFRRFFGGFAGRKRE